MDYETGIRLDEILGRVDSLQKDMAKLKKAASAVDDDEEDLEEDDDKPKKKKPGRPSREDL